MRRRLLTAGLVLIALTGCHRSEPQAVGTADASLNATDQLAQDAARLDRLANAYSDDQDRIETAAAASNAVAAAGNDIAAGPSGNAE